LQQIIEFMPPTPLPSHDDLATPVGTTLERYIMRKQAEFPFATGELSQLLRDIALASKIMVREVSRAGLSGLSDVVAPEGQDTPPRHRLGEEAHVRFVRALTNGRECYAILSKASADIIDTGNHDGRYVVALNPMNGSVSLDFNVSTGTIFSIYRRVSRYGGPARVEDFLQGGRAQVAAGYILYGSSVMLVYTTGHGVAGFTHEPSLGEFFLSHPKLTIPATGEVFSCNEGNWFDFPEFARTFLTTCKERRMAAHYVGSLAADYHRNLFTGGIYLYPHRAVAQRQATPALRVLPHRLHQRTSWWRGSYRDRRSTRRAPHRRPAPARAPVRGLGRTGARAAKCGRRLILLSITKYQLSAELVTSRCKQQAYQPISCLGSLITC